MLLRTRLDEAVAAREAAARETAGADIGLRQCEADLAASRSQLVACDRERFELREHVNALQTAARDTEVPRSLEQLPHLCALMNGSHMPLRRCHPV